NGRRTRDFILRDGGRARPRPPFSQGPDAMKARASFLTFLALGLFVLGCGRSSPPAGKVEKPSWFTKPDPTSSQARPDLTQRQIENLNTKIATYNESRVLNKKL